MFFVLALKILKYIFIFSFFFIFFISSLFCFCLFIVILFNLCFFFQAVEDESPVADNMKVFYLYFIGYSVWFILLSVRFIISKKKVHSWRCVFFFFIFKHSFWITYWILYVLILWTVLHSFSNIPSQVFKLSYINILTLCAKF